MPRGRISRTSSLMDSPDSGVFRILSVDGGGAKGFYTLGVLKQIEAMLGGNPLCERFDLIFGTSTGAIIAALLGLGRGVDEIHDLYKKEVPGLMRTAGAGARSTALERLAAYVDFGILGYVIVGLFLLAWGSSVALWQFGYIKERYGGHPATHSHAHRHDNGTQHSHVTSTCISQKRRHSYF
jgi:hypothetical protein